MATDEWTHAICLSCWRKRQSNNNIPISTLGGGEMEMCCWCGAPARSGIYVRAEPTGLACSQRMVSAQNLQTLIERDTAQWPEGHPCRNCNALFKEHPTAHCENWR